MIINRTNNGIMISDIINNQYIHRLYIGYTTRQAIKLFKMNKTIECNKPKQLTPEQIELRKALLKLLDCPELTGEQLRQLQDIGIKLGIYGL